MLETLLLIIYIYKYLYATKIYFLSAKIILHNNEKIKEKKRDRIKKIIN